MGEITQRESIHELQGTGLELPEEEEESQRHPEARRFLNSQGSQQSQAAGVSLAWQTTKSQKVHEF